MAGFSTVLTSPFCRFALGELFAIIERPVVADDTIQSRRQKHADLDLEFFAGH